MDGYCDPEEMGDDDFLSNNLKLYIYAWVPYTFSFRLENKKNLYLSFFLTLFIQIEKYV